MWSGPPWGVSTPYEALRAGKTVLGCSRARHQVSAPYGAAEGVEGVGQAMLHRTANDQGVMTMRGLDDGLPIGAQGHVALQPGGDHLMLMGLSKPLRPGDELQAVLEFAHAGQIAVKIPVLPISATGPKP